MNASTDHTVTGSTLTPDRLQQRALTALTSHVGDGGRAVLVMPCGSGKTLVGRWLAERVDAELAVVCVPSLALLPQTLTAWRMHGSGWAHRSMIVGSDPSSGRVVRADDLELPGWARGAVRASTAVPVITDFLSEPGPGPRLIVSTYHSAPKVASALRRARKAADLLVCDEAHRLAGRPRSEFRAVLDEQRFPAQRRVAMTATPVEAAAWEDDLGDTARPGTLSLDDIATFGPVAHRASFGDAVDAGRLVDYDVHVLARPADDSGADARSVNAAAAVLSAARDGATRILTFHTRVSHAAALAAHLDGRLLPGGKRIRALHLESAHNARERQAVLDRLTAPGENEVVVVASARVLSEGVDVPAVDTVVFADPRTSSVDIVQAAGRAMRTAPGKTRGRIVLTVDLGDDPDGLDDDSRFAASRWRHVWLVLRSLASMDPRFRREMQRQAKAPATKSRPGPSLTATLPEGWDTQRWMLRALDHTGAAWWERFRDLERFAAQHGHARPSQHTDPSLASWVTRQRTMWRDGLLDEDQVRALESLPGWVWSGRDAAWWHGWESWHRWSATPAARTLTGQDRWISLAETPAGGAQSRYRSLAEFAVDTCLLRRRGELAANLETAAQQLPGWRWDMLPADDAAMIDALAEYAAWKKTMNVPHGYVHDGGLRVGAWLTSVRRRRYTGRISVVLETALDMLSVRLAGQGIEKLSWDAGDTAWRLGYLALRQFQAREGTCRIPYQHVESLPDIDINLSRWCVVQRQQYRLGKLSAIRITTLEQVPGWQWEIELRPGYRPVLDDADHGARKGYAKGCRCDECTDANSSYEDTRINGSGTDLVDAGPARGKVRILRGQGASQKAIARAADLNVKTIAELENAILARVRPETENDILALTIGQVRQAEKAGRWGGTEPAAPVLQLVDEMTALGWPRAWIAREIGQSRALQLGKGGTVSVGNARKIRELRQGVGSMTAPPRTRRQELPPLAEIIAGLRTASLPSHRITGRARADRTAGTWALGRDPLGLDPERETCANGAGDAFWSSVRGRVPGPLLREPGAGVDEQAHVHAELERGRGLLVFGDRQQARRVRPVPGPVKAAQEHLAIVAVPCHEDGFAGRGIQHPVARLDGASGPGSLPSGPGPALVHLPRAQCQGCDPVAPWGRRALRDIALVQGRALAEEGTGVIVGGPPDLLAVIARQAGDLVVGRQAMVVGQRHAPGSLAGALRAI